MASIYDRDERYQSSSRHREKHKERSESRSDDLNSSSPRQRGESSRSRRRGSHTSMSETRKKRSRSGFRLHNDEDYDLSEQLYNEDFKLMLALAPTPDEAFCPKSLDHAKAVKWRNKLLGWQCETIQELRLRQAYMSYFSVCLNQKQMRGIFQQEPQDTLCRVDFQDVVVPNAGCMSSMGDESAWLGMMSTLQHQGSCCSQQPSGSRHAGGFNNSNRRKYPQATTHKLAYKSRPKLVPKSNLSLSQSSSCRSSFDSFTASSSSLVAELPRIQTRSHQRRPIDQQTRKDMDYLLALITSELSGEQLSEPDDYFELELKRYREFYARHRCNDPNHQPLVAAADLAKERTHMLLNMQNDLIKLLSN
ncbi:uncharacterized protein LOC133840948 [Drosophila sulfurigaster albostrigata]|uniref:uncharacterized protein LOC133840948 n=1 Tax=Drosophila sulfurigaster albostrigata TaxID=89887 RepID=UPI002D219993|nr:uncharacterized protein LOC133840948 [Drosophila sulfurigaster albostrigata]